MPDGAVDGGLAFERRDNRTTVVYAVGAVYGFSRSAVMRLVSTSCMRRLGEIRCGRNCVRASSGGRTPPSTAPCFKCASTRRT